MDLIPCEFSRTRSTNLVLVSSFAHRTLVGESGSRMKVSAEHECDDNTRMLHVSLTGGDKRPDGEGQDDPLPAFKARGFRDLVESPTVKRCNRGGKRRHRLPDGCNEWLLRALVPLNGDCEKAWSEGGFGET